MIKILFLAILISLAIGGKAQCPEERCSHSPQFWADHSCFSSPAYSWPGPVSSSFLKFVENVFPGMNECDLRTNINIVSNHCLNNFQGADYIRMDLTDSSPIGNRLFQQFYTYVLNTQFKILALAGPCPVGTDGLPSSLENNSKRITLIEEQIIVMMRNFFTLLFVSFNDLMYAYDCELTTVDEIAIQDLLSFLTALNELDKCTEPEECTGGCTYSQGYWKNHNLYGKNAVAWPSVTTQATEDVLLCNVTLGKWLTGKKNDLSQFGNAQLILARQWIAATMNDLNGACPPDAISNALYDGELILGDNCNKSIPTSNEPTGKTMLELSSKLEEYNLGLAGPESCD